MGVHLQWESAVVGLIVLIAFHFLGVENISIRYYCRNVANVCLIQFCVILGFDFKFNMWKDHQRACWAHG